jgi:tRNA pseudouridine55 synthase
MAQYRRVKRDINGVLLLDKPLGFSSNQALQKVKWLFQAAKAGHTGTLDPLATGLLPICLGEATKFAQYVTDADKTYIATVKFGETTTTGDAEGQILAKHPVDFDLSKLTVVCQAFVGEINQVPPMYSALKFEGKALYEYAREGVDIERKARVVTITSIHIDAFENEIAVLTVSCSKGTYIRTLAEDIGHQLGCGAHLVGLRRIETAGYLIEDAITLDTLESLIKETAVDALGGLLLPIDSAIAYLPKVILNADAAHYLMQGQAVWQSGIVPQGDLRLYDDKNQFLGLGVLQEDGKIAPKRLMRDPNTVQNKAKI